MSYDPTKLCHERLYGKTPYDARETVCTAILQSTANEARPEPVKVEVKPLPCTIIFVHGVNSEGEWYEKADEYFCAGLNERLGRTDIAPNEYVRSEETGELKITPGNSPVIPFFWGYAEHGKEIGKYDIDLHPLRPEDQIDPDAAQAEGAAGIPVPTTIDAGVPPGQPRYWGGGPVQNATATLNELYLEGLQKLWSIVTPNILNPSPDRKIRKSPPRYYMVHAAQRLALLIDSIRATCVGQEQTINLVCHSQGNMIALLAQTLTRYRCADTLILNNATYSLDEPAATLTLGNPIDSPLHLPSKKARIQTFVNLCKRVKESYSEIAKNNYFGEDKLKSDLIRTLISTRDKESFQKERDNRGRVFLNFCVHDRAVGISTLQGIGWKGVDQAAFNDLKGMGADNFYQRAFGGGETVGSAPHLYRLSSARVDGVFWYPPSERIIANFRVHDDPDERLIPINAEAVPQPVYLKKRGESGHEELEDFDRGAAKLAEQNEARELPYRVRDFDYKEIPGTRPIQDPFSRGEMENKAQHDRRALDTPSPITDHGDILAHPDYTERIIKNVLSYDLAIGINSVQRDKNFWEYLHTLGDWMKSDPYFSDTVEALTPKDIGEMPADIDRELAAKPLVPSPEGYGGSFYTLQGREEQPRLYLTPEARDELRKTGEAKIENATIKIVSDAPPRNTAPPAAKKSGAIV